MQKSVSSTHLFIYSHYVVSYGCCMHCLRVFYRKVKGKLIFVTSLQVSHLTPAGDVAFEQCETANTEILQQVNFILLLK